jgi:hypothetical protein
VARGSHVPHQCLNRARATFMPGTTWPGIQEPARFIPGQQLDPGFGNRSYAFDTSSVVHSRSPSRLVPDASCAPFPQCSSPRLIHRSNLRRFETSPCVGGLGGPTSITSAASRRKISSTPKPPVVFVAHDRPRISPVRGCPALRSRHLCRSRRSGPRRPPPSRAGPH